MVRIGRHVRREALLTWGTDDAEVFACSCFGHVWLGSCLVHVWLGSCLVHVALVSHWFINVIMAILVHETLIVIKHRHFSIVMKSGWLLGLASGG